MKKYNIVDLFCGAGGMSIGLELTGRFRTVGAIDNWKPAIDTFRYNHPSVPEEKIICDDLSKIYEREYQDKLISIWDAENIDIDVVIGGPPCQGMSLAGKRLSNDPRNQLFQCFVEAVKILKPKIFIMENVPGLLTAEKGAIKNAIFSAFKDINYDHFHDHAPEILKAETYGVPQIRRRLFFVGFAEGFDSSNLVWIPPQTHSANSNIGTLEQLPLSDQLEKEHVQLQLFGDQIDELPPPITVWKAISDLPQIKSGEGADEMEYPKQIIQLSPYQKKMRDWSQCPRKEEKPNVYNHEASNHTENLINMIKAAAPGESVDPKYTDSKKWHPHKPGYTVKALGAGGGSTNRRAFHYNPDTPRGSTVRENARIQSFPDWYRFLGAKTHQMTQVGNAVPPLLASAIGNVIAACLDGNAD